MLAGVFTFYQSVFFSSSGKSFMHWAPDRLVSSELVIVLIVLALRFIDDDPATLTPGGGGGRGYSPQILV